MKWSLFVGKVSGIKIYIHWTFLILIFWVIASGERLGYGTEEILWNLGFIMAIFACIVLHELGHALTAKQFNFKTRHITLLPIGGVAQIEGLPDKPVQEFLVASMGPVVNLAISFILFIILKIINAYPLPSGDMHLSKETFIFQLYTVNIFLALFNLIPAFPMDGGRILRAILSIKLSRLRATRIAAYVAQFIAILFIFLGFLYNPFLVLIGLFVLVGARTEAGMEETKSLLNNIKISDVLMHNYSELQIGEPVSKAVSVMLDSQERSFIIKDDGTVKGTLSKREILEGLSRFGADVPIEQIMRTKIVPLHEQDKINEVMQIFSEGTDTLMPVFEGDKITGVINLENIYEFVEVQSALNRSEKSHQKS
jgi:Zn-dependent protease/predicted transcriptional regulator